jgi:hypothetical protein
MTSTMYVIIPVGPLLTPAVSIKVSLVGLDTSGAMNVGLRDVGSLRNTRGPPICVHKSE